MEKLGSDHKAVLVKFTSDKEFFRGQFWFDKRAGDPFFLEMIQHAWNDNNPLGSNSIIVRTENCRRAICDWRHKVWSNSEIRIRRLRKYLKDQDESRTHCFKRIDVIKKELAIAFREEEVYWRQKSREKWLSEGDQNTKFFHASVKNNRVKNSLHTLLDDQGQVQTSD